MHHKGLFRAVLCLGIFAAGAGLRAGDEGALEIIALDELRPGMKGTAKTVFSGTKVESFPIEIVDVVRNLDVGRDAILIRSSDPRLLRYGIAQGMSGSPVYVDGRLAGAISFSFKFAKEPLGGVTPIQDMLDALADDDGPAASRPAARTPRMPLPREADELAFHRVAARLLRERYRDSDTSGPLPWYATPAAEPDATDYGNALPLETPVWVQGLSGKALKMLEESLSPMNMIPLAAGPGGVEAGPPPPLEPGSVIGVRMAEGAADVTAMGTVTARIGDRLLAFGHGLLSEGEVDFTMAAGKVHTVVSSMMASFKIGTAMNTVGRFRRDTPSGVVGHLGEGADMIPITFAFKGEPPQGDAPGGDADTFAYRVTRHPDFAGRLIPIIALALAQRQGELPEENTVHYSVSIELAGHRAITFEDDACGRSSTMGLAMDVMAVISDLLRNPYEDVVINKVDMALSWRRGMRKANIKDLRIVTPEARPGEDIEIEVTLAPFRKKLEKTRITVTVPDDTIPGPRMLVVGDAETAIRMDIFENIRRASPESVDAFIDLVNTPRDRRTLSAWLVRDDVGMASDEGELPGLPGSVLALLAEAPRTGMAPLFDSATAEVETPYVLTGRQTITIDVLEKEHP